MEFKDIEIPKIKREWCADLSEDSLLTADRLAPMAGRITALGESVHGSSKINRATCDFIKSGILNGNVSMVILENSMMLMLFFNRYVQGYDDVSIDQLKEFMQYGVSDIDSEGDLVINQRFQKLCRLRQMGVYVDEAHHLFGTALKNALSDKKSETSLRTTVNLLNGELTERGSGVVACYNYTGTPFVENKVLPEVVYAYGLSRSIANGYLKTARVVAY